MRAAAGVVLVGVLAAPARADERTCSLPPGACEQPVTMRRPFALWKPLAALGGGVALVLGGVVLRVQAVSDLEDYEAAIARTCGASGCQPEDIPAEVRQLEDRAQLENALAIGAFVVGGLLLIGGVVGVVIDYPRPTPVVTRDTVGVVLEGRF